MNPKLKAVLYPLLAALAGALASYFATGCNPSQLSRAESAADRVEVQLMCAKAALKAHDAALVTPGLEDLPAAADLALALKACLKAAPMGDPDAGAR